MTFENIYLGTPVTGDGDRVVPGDPPWLSLSILPAKVWAEDMEVDSRGFAVP